MLGDTARQRTTRRAALLAAALLGGAGALLFGGDEARAAATCVWDSDSEDVTITVTGDDTVTIGRTAGGLLQVTGGGITDADCDVLASRSTMTHVGTITVATTDLATPPNEQTVVIDLGNGPLAPGNDLEADNSSPEIEIVVDLEDGNDSVEVRGQAGTDQFTAGVGGVNLNASESASPDIDLTLTNVETVKLNGRAGNDTITGAGGAGTGAAATQGITFLGGANDDILTGGDGNDVFDEEAAANGADTIVGGGGTGDEVTYASRSDAVNVSIDGNDNDGSVAADEKDDIDVENVTGGEGDDTLSGSSGNDTFKGGDGADGVDTVSYESRTEGFTITLATTSTLGAANRSGESDVIHSSIENVVGSQGDDDITGNDSDNRLDGHEGDDDIDGSGGDDILVGGADDDTLTGGESGETNGDTADYSSATTGVSLNLGVTTAQNTVGAGNDTITQVEHVTGSPEDDTLIGDGAGNTLKGGEGDDTLTGAGGDDTQDGGGGSDILTFATRTGPITVEFSGAGAGGTASATDGTATASDTFTSVELVVGSPQNDTFKSSTAGDNFDGGAGTDDVVDYSGLTSGTNVTVDLGATPTQTATGHGNDTFVNVENVTGGGGNDTLIGDANDNELLGNAGNDVLRGNAGNDTINGGDTTDLTGTTPGSDTADYSTATATVTVTLDTATSTQSTTSTQNTGGAGTDSITKIEHLTGGSGNDTLTGDGTVNTLNGGAGNDTLNGRPGDDILIGGADNDRLSAGGGSDTAVYSGAPSGVVVNLGALPEQTATGGHGTDVMAGIVQVIGSAFGDTITGDAAANVLNGGDGDDTLVGGDNDDELNGGDGDDTLRGGADDDELNGDDGTGDTADYSAATAAVNASLTTGTATGEGSDMLATIENLTGSPQADTLTGNGDANVLTGGDSGDTLDGAGGNDTASYGSASAGLIADLATPADNTGDADDDIYGPTSTAPATIENLTGSSGNDSLRGDGADNVLDGGDGDDTLVGRAGNDTLTGGESGETNGDTADYGDASSAVTVDLDAGTAAGDGSDTLTGIENAVGSDQDDTLSGDAGDNDLDGGNGVDTLSYANADAGVTVDLDGGTATGDGSDTLTGFEDVTGSGHDDVLGGDDGDNTIDGGAGTDTVSYAAASVPVAVDLCTTDPQVTGAGEDTIVDIENVTGSPQNDTLSGDDGDNAIDGGAGTDTVTFADAAAGVEADLTTGTAEGDGDDTLANLENVIGSDFGDVLVGNAGANTLTGGDGDDAIDGRNGNDIENGGLGNDLFDQGNAKNGGDTISGGTGGETGSDTVDYTGRTNAVSVTKNGVADDGESGEGDNVGADVETVLVVNPPGAPTGVTATAGNGLATVKWTAPTNNGGSPITGYVVTATPGGTTAKTSGMARSATVAPLTNGTTYRFTVKAVNVRGTGTASALSNAVTPLAPTTTTTTTPTNTQGYALLDSDGGVSAFGAAGDFGDIPALGLALNEPPIGMAYTPTGKGYWIVAEDGGIFSFGDAKFFGSMGATPLNAPVLGMEPTPTGKGYWLFAGDGGIFGFGDATFFGSMGGTTLNEPVVGMAATSTGKGYWLVAEDGGIFGFGDAKFFGSMGGAQLNEPVFDMASTADDSGYWLVARDGGIFAFGGAKFFGSAGGTDIAPVVGMGRTPAGKGYWIADEEGVVYAFGEAKDLGDLSDQDTTVVGFAALPK